MSYKGVLFDLDGTLLDTLKDLADSVNRVLVAEGWPAHPIDAYRYFVGDGARNLVMRAMPEIQREPAVIQRVLETYRADYTRTWNVTSRPYDGIVPMLNAVQQAGARLGVLSNKPHALTIRCMEGYLPQFRWDAVLGQRDGVPHKPDPAGAFEAARLMGLAPGDVLYVGDTGTDMRTARAAGMFSLGATWGFRTEQELRASGASAIIHHPREIVAYVAG